MSQKRGPWKVVESKVVVETPHLRLRSDNIELPDGRHIENYFVRETRGFAIIFAVTPDRRVVLVRQYKHGIGESVLELPAGAIDPGESAATCARRELAEETGFVGEPPEPESSGTFITDPTSSDGRFWLFLVRDARPLLAQNLDVTEEIDVELATFEELRRYVRDGSISVIAHVGAIYYMLDCFGEL